MAAPNFNAPRAALTLVDAAHYGDKHAAEKWGVSLRSVQRWRSRMDDDPELAALVAIGLQKRESDWASELTPAILSGAGFIQRAAQEADHTDADTITAVADAVAQLAEVKLASDMVRARAEPQVDEVYVP